MSKSLRRVEQAMEALGLEARILECPEETRTAEQAANVAGCHIDQIVKSILFRSLDSGHVVLFMTAGGNQVCPEKASKAAGEALGKADAALIRAETGFAIGGVAPIGHLKPVRCFFDPRLRDFSEVWAAAGTPRHIFPAPPDEILRATNAEVIDFTI